MEDSILHRMTLIIYKNIFWNTANDLLYECQKKFMRLQKACIEIFVYVHNKRWANENAYHSKKQGEKSKLGGNDWDGPRKKRDIERLCSVVVWRYGKFIFCSDITTHRLCTFIEWVNQQCARVQKLQKIWSYSQLTGSFINLALYSKAPICTSSHSLFWCFDE